MEDCIKSRMKSKALEDLDFIQVEKRGDWRLTLQEIRYIRNSQRWQKQCFEPKWILNCRIARILERYKGRFDGVWSFSILLNRE